MLQSITHIATPEEMGRPLSSRSGSLSLSPRSPSITCKLSRNFRLFFHKYEKLISDLNGGLSAPGKHLQCFGIESTRNQQTSKITLAVTKLRKKLSSISSGHGSLTAQPRVFEEEKREARGRDVMQKYASFSSRSNDVPTSSQGQEKKIEGALRKAKSVGNISSGALIRMPKQIRRIPYYGPSAQHFAPHIFKHSDGKKAESVSGYQASDEKIDEVLEEYKAHNLFGALNSNLLLDREWVSQEGLYPTYDPRISGSEDENEASFRIYIRSPSSSEDNDTGEHLQDWNGEEMIQDVLFQDENVSRLGHSLHDEPRS